ncbi:MAG TPA: VOC family protein [Solirubrobacteraceae bacterium]
MSAVRPTASDATSGAGLPAALRLGPVHLVVTDLDRSVQFYEHALGLRTLRRGGAEAALGTGDRAVLVLHADTSARPPGRHAGLYHYALLSPTRAELARAGVRLWAAGTPVQGASDHGTHEAIYLADPDGNGIELAADRPRDLWPAAGFEIERGGPAPLDLADLFSVVRGEDVVAEAAPGLGVGHLHLFVGDVEAGLGFYRDVIGFDVYVRMDSAAFVSAGGYHHHLGFNVWRGQGIPAAPAGTVGLEHWTVSLPTASDVAAVRARVDAAGQPVREVEGGFAVRDPWDMELHVVGSPG